MNRLAWVLAITLLAGCEGDGGHPIVGQLASDRVELRAEFAEKVVARPAAEGQQVQSGDPIVQQDTARIDARRREFDAQLALQQARLDELTRGPRREQITAARAELEGALQDVEFRETELRRAADLLQRSLGSQEALDRAQAALDSARARANVLDAQLAELLAGTTVEELRQATQQLEVTRAQLEQLDIDRRRHMIVAPAPARVDTLLIEPGERPQPGEPVAILLTGEQPYARVYIPEDLRASVTPGTQVTAHIDGYAGTVPGRVRWVAGDAAFTPYFALTEHDRGRLSYAAKIDLELDGERLPDGVPVEVMLANSESP